MNTRATGALRRGQALAESLFGVTFRAECPGGLVVDDNGLKVPGTVPVGTCLGKFAGSTRSSRDASTRMIRIGGVERPIIESGLHIPVSAFISEGLLQIEAGERGKGWEFVAIAVAPELDQSLLGRRVLVVGVPAKSYATARRLDVVEL